MWTWITLGLIFGLVVGILVGVNVARFFLERRVTRKLQLIESMARRAQRRR